MTPPTNGSGGRSRSRSIGKGTRAGGAVVPIRPALSSTLVTTTTTAASSAALNARRATFEPPAVTTSPIQEHT